MGGTAAMLRHLTADAESKIHPTSHQLPNLATTPVFTATAPPICAEELNTDGELSDCSRSAHGASESAHQLPRVPRVPVLCTMYTLSVPVTTLANRPADCHSASATLTVRHCYGACTGINTNYSDNGGFDCGCSGPAPPLPHGCARATLALPGAAFLRARNARAVMCACVRGVHWPPEALRRGSFELLPLIALLCVSCGLLPRMATVWGPMFLGASLDRLAPPVLLAALSRLLPVDPGASEPLPKTGRVRPEQLHGVANELARPLVGPLAPWMIRARWGLGCMARGLLGLSYTLVTTPALGTLAGVLAPGLHGTFLILYGGVVHEALLRYVSRQRYRKSTWREALSGLPWLTLSATTASIALVHMKLAGVLAISSTVALAPAIAVASGLHLLRGTDWVRRSPWREAVVRNEIADRYGTLMCFTRLLAALALRHMLAVRFDGESVTPDIIPRPVKDLLWAGTWPMRALFTWSFSWDGLRGVADAVRAALLAPWGSGDAVRWYSPLCQLPRPYYRGLARRLNPLLWLRNWLSPPRIFAAVPLLEVYFGTSLALSKTDFGDSGDNSTVDRDPIDIAAHLNVAVTCAFP